MNKYWSDEQNCWRTFDIMDAIGEELKRQGLEPNGSFMELLHVTGVNVLPNQAEVSVALPNTEIPEWEVENKIKDAVDEYIRKNKDHNLLHSVGEAIKSPPKIEPQNNKRQDVIKKLYFAMGMAQGAVSNPCNDDSSQSCFDKLHRTIDEVINIIEGE